MTREEVALLLPFGPEFLFIDAVHQVHAGKTIITSMRYDDSQPFQRAHFLRGRHVVPASLITEQVCQSAFLLGVLSGELAEGEVFLLGRTQTVFEKPATPPCSIVAEVSFRARLEKAVGFAGKVTLLSGETLARVSAVAKRVAL